MANIKRSKQPLSITHPELCIEWDADKNIPLTPDNVTAGNGKKVWWKCKNGHEWMAIISNRAKGNGCPYCVGQWVFKGENDLATRCPELVSEWNVEKNGQLSPEDVTSGSGKKVWWKCEKGHEWESPVYVRTKGIGCPICRREGAKLARYENKLKKDGTLLLKYPQIAKEWNYEKNKGIVDKKGNHIATPDRVTALSNETVWWRCENGHEWQSKIASRVKGRQCPYCCGKQLVKGENDLSTQRPELVKEWNYDKNGDLDPKDISFNSDKIVWWKCQNGHEWETAVFRRVKGSECPECKIQRICIDRSQSQISKKGSLADKYPQIAKEWDYEKNRDLTDKTGRDISKPCFLSVSSNQKVWWKCEKGHEWKISVYSRTIKSTGCPYCSNKKILIGYNDLETVNPQLAKEWNYEKNQGLVDKKGNDISTPDKLAGSSNKKVWWKCEKGHEWEATVSSRASGNNCPFCAGQRVIVGENDIFSLDPILASEWNYEKNGNVSPQNVTLRNNKKYWWKCEKGHEWQNSPYNRSNGDRCPFCSGSGTSIAEQGVAYYLSLVCIVESRAKISGKEVDVFLPEYKVGVEYDGKRYHEGKELKELEKDRVLMESGIYLIRIKESNENKVIDDTIIHYAYDNMRKNYEWALNETCKLLSVLTDDERFLNIDINLKRDRLKIRERTQLLKKNNSISVSSPSLCLEWDYVKNGSLKPEMFSSGSGEKVWWKCEAGHSWQSAINQRVRGNGCPYCSKRRVIPGETDLVSVNPDYLKEWDYDKNELLSPREFKVGSTKKVWWKCTECGKEWQSSIASRSMGHDCPECDKKKAYSRQVKAKIKKVGSFLESYPQVAEEWNYDKNGMLRPEMFTPSSGVKVWWRCSKCNNEWQAIIASRAKGHGCPICGIKKLCYSRTKKKVENAGSLLEKCPEVAKEWNYDKNVGLTPDKVTAKTNRKVWWKCSKGHEWEATVNRRSSGSGCPFCSGRKALIGFNDLTTTNPELVLEWDYEKNNELSPEMFTRGAETKVWWKCEKGHSWLASIGHRTSGRGCPYCCGKRHQQIKCVETGDTFSTFAEAARYCSMKSSGEIALACKNVRKTVGGYHWEYVY